MGRHPGGVTVNFRSTLAYTEEMFHLDPISTLRHATEEMLHRAREAYLEKMKVLDEIENGTNRYRVEGGRFKNVGEQFQLKAHLLESDPLYYGFDVDDKER